MSSQSEVREIDIDLVSDVVCPWCVIGYHQLSEAARRSDIQINVTWQPFELNPHMAAEGENLREHLAKKYGTTPLESRAARERLTTLGAELGFRFNYADDMRMVNTFRAHQLIHWAESQGKGETANLALFEAFFTERRDLNDVDVLCRVAESLGLDVLETREVLQKETYASAVREQQAYWQQQGISGVPAMLFNRRYLVTGAQGVERYMEILQTVVAETAVT
ncbi:DsbA family oxidoreductase [Marinobacter sp. SS21]|uniref:DsbA family oxidoreductase n=1 Tax=Marinobacter sp. SS21 TaxID=2979460 RepID=UPI00232C3668|nr:DsbA family oxidoreductase [Marinobacter sp. SS21]MDC0664273.1 DsbA family oxidoreductase [Marinobacter sp. SS21]